MNEFSYFHWLFFGVLLSKQAFLPALICLGIVGICQELPRNRFIILLVLVGLIISFSIWGAA